MAFSPGAAAKDFKPGDVSVCNANRCVPIKCRPVLNALSAFYYDSSMPPARSRPPKLGGPFFRLELSNGYVTGIIAGSRLGRFLSYGVNLDQFRATAWYRVPTVAVAGLGELTVGLTPLRLTGAALAGHPAFGPPSPAATRPGLARRAAAGGGHGGGTPWALGLLSLAALIAVASLRRPRRRSELVQ